MRATPRVMPRTFRRRKSFRRRPISHLAVSSRWPLMTPTMIDSAKLFTKVATAVSTTLRSQPLQKIVRIGTRPKLPWHLSMLISSLVNRKSARHLCRTRTTTLSTRQHLCSLSSSATQQMVVVALTQPTTFYRPSAWKNRLIWPRDMLQTSDRGGLLLLSLPQSTRLALLVGLSMATSLPLRNGRRRNQATTL